MVTHSVGWSLSPQLVVIVSALLIGYCFLVRFRFTKKSLFFFSGLTLITIALAAPMGPSKYHDLFSAHMFQHILFLMMSPPLLVSGLPAERLRPFFSKPAVRKIAKRLFNPFFTWILGVSTMWFWHVPAIYNFMVLPMHPQWMEPVMKGVEAVSLISVGIVYCWPILSPLDEYRLPAGKGIVYLFSACTGCSILGMLLVFSSPGMYVTAFQGPVKTVWDMSASLDQQVGGLLMWVPGCFIYLSGVIVLLTRWFSGKEEQQAGRTKIITSENTIKIRSTMADIKQNEESWNKAQPEHLPHPTYWPITLALGVTFFFWGFVTSIIISLVGIVVITIAMIGWISVLRSEFNHQNHQKESGERNGS